MGRLTGNVLNDKQRPMVESRMRKRLLDLKLSNPRDYKLYWENNLKVENSFLIGLLTTHFTSFFREFRQFEWLACELPALIRNAKNEGRSTLKFWSSACSKGQEVWSLCMWLHHHMIKLDSTMKWVVYGSDIDSNSVDEAENAVYHRRELETVPRHLWENHWVRGKDDISDWYRVKRELRSHVKFMSLNLLDLKMPRSESFDVIFCRNVLIYFDRFNQEKVARSLMDYLTPQGALITGVSESLSGYGLPLKGVSPSIYKLLNAEILNFPEIKKDTRVEFIIPKPLKVLCIDDSPTVLTILKKVLNGNEFLVVGTAANGQEAIEKFKSLKPDVVTLDLHMPVMDGPTFLKTSGIAESTPVIVVSSVDRDDHFLLDPLFALGVCDFVEKPTLVNMEKVFEELSQKLKMGWTAKNKKIEYKTQNSIIQRIKRPNGHIIINCGPNDFSKVIRVIKERPWSDDEITFYVNGLNADLAKLKNDVASYLKVSKVHYILSKDFLSSSILPGIWLHFCDGNEESLRKNKRIGHYLVMEEMVVKQDLKNLADELSPATSFSYLVDKLLSGK